jgi:hypothetical protein
MYNAYIQNIKARKMSRKQTVYYLYNLINGARYELQRIETTISDPEIELTEQDLDQLEADLDFFQERVLEVKKTAKHLGVYSEDVFEFGDFSDVHWREDDFVTVI